MRSYHTSLPGLIKIVHLQYLPTKEAMKLTEKLLHYILSSYRSDERKEWFRTDNVRMFSEATTALDRIVDFIMI